MVTVEYLLIQVKELIQNNKDCLEDAKETSYSFNAEWSKKEYISYLTGIIEAYELIKTIIEDDYIDEISKF